MSCIYCGAKHCGGDCDGRPDYHRHFNRWNRGIFMPHPHDWMKQPQPEWLDTTRCPFVDFGVHCPYMHCCNSECIPF